MTRYPILLMISSTFIVTNADSNYTNITDDSVSTYDRSVEATVSSNVNENTQNESKTLDFTSSGAIWIIIGVALTFSNIIFGTCIVIYKKRRKRRKMTNPYTVTQSTTKGSSEKLEEDPSNHIYLEIDDAQLLNELGSNNKANDVNDTYLTAVEVCVKDLPPDYLEICDINTNQTGNEVYNIKSYKDVPRFRDGRTKIKLPFENFVRNDNDKNNEYLEIISDDFAQIRSRVSRFDLDIPENIMDDDLFESLNTFDKYFNSLSLKRQKVSGECCRHSACSTRSGDKSVDHLENIEVKVIHSSKNHIAEEENKQIHKNTDSVYGETSGIAYFGPELSKNTAEIQCLKTRSSSVRSNTSQKYIHLNSFGNEISDAEEHTCERNDPHIDEIQDKEKLTTIESTKYTQLQTLSKDDVCLQCDKAHFKEIDTSSHGVQLNERKTFDDCTYMKNMEITCEYENKLIAKQHNSSGENDFKVPEPGLQMFSFSFESDDISQDTENNYRGTREYLSQISDSQCGVIKEQISGNNKLEIPLDTTFGSDMKRSNSSGFELQLCDLE